MVSRIGMKAADPEDQFGWHAAFRDAAKNQYRTSYLDMSHGREVCVKTDFPSGYGGHIPAVRHDILFRNTVFNEEISRRRYDIARDAFPAFTNQILGVPTSTSSPQGAKNVPTYGIIPHDGTTTMLKPPWSILTSKNQPLNHRTTPQTTPRSGGVCATPRRESGSGLSNCTTPRPGSEGRVNEVAMQVGAKIMGDRTQIPLENETPRAVVRIDPQA